MTKDEKYQLYANDLVLNVPTEHLQYLIALFMFEAAINMGSEVNDKTLERTIYYIQKDYGYIPISYVASAFIQGSLGKLPSVTGMTRLVPKTIHYWLGEVSMEYNRAMAKKRQKDKESDVVIACDLHKIPFGQAIIQKVTWYKEGKLDDDDWDRVELKELAEAIARKEEITFDKFYK